MRTHRDIKLVTTERRRNSIVSEQSYHTRKYFTVHLLAIVTYGYLKDDSSDNKKSKDPKTCVMKRKLRFENSKNYLEATQVENKINYLKNI